MEIARLKPDQKKRAARIAADAFFDYEQIRYYFPDSARRKHRLSWYMERVMNTAMSFGEVLVTEDFSGVLFVLPPGRTRLSDSDYIKNGFLRAPLVVGLRRYPAVDTCEKYVADTRERLTAGRPHYYLWGLAADPAKQRTGVGTALLEHLLRRTDTENLPVFLETHRQANVPYYEQRGFKLIHTDTVPKHNLDFWCMLHEPGDIFSR